MTVRPRLVLHPGFHRTGCRSIQAFLSENRQALQTTTVVLPKRLGTTLSLCLRFSRHADPLALSDVSAALETDLAAVGPMTGDIIISAPDLLGHIPGIRDVMSYAAAPALLHQLVSGLGTHFPHHDLRLILTTRNREDWLFSAYRHHVAQRRLVLNRSEFETIFQRAGDLDRAVEQCRLALAGTQIITLPLETAATHPLGPGGAFLAAAGWPEAQVSGLRAVPTKNAALSADLWPTFFRLNWRIKNSKDLKSRKAALLADHAAKRPT